MKKGRFLSSSFALKDHHISIIEVLLIVCISSLPLFRSFRGDPTVYLSWEGAYRLYLGQVPYRDFGLPMGFGYWIIPAIFFKIFGPFLSSLIKAQVLINIVCAFAFRSILKSFQVPPIIRLFSILILIFSYLFNNRWPWYNSSVIVFELVSFAFLLYYLLKDNLKYKLAYLFVATFFLFLSFFTKQDSGGLAFVIALVLLICNSIYKKKYGSVFVFAGFYLIISFAIIAPFLAHGFTYWFDYGQPPHNSRISLYDLIDVFLADSNWIKVYLFAILLILLKEGKDWPAFLKNRTKVLFTLLTLGIILQAAIIRVTSYVPIDNNIFFHSFAVAYIFSAIKLDEVINFRKPMVAIITVSMILLWWSKVPWKTVNGFVYRKFPKLAQIDTTVVSMRTQLLKDLNTSKKPITWVRAPWKEFSGMEMNAESIKGMERILNLPVVKEKGDSLRLLNMSELTPLENILGVKLETGRDIPLWYHKNVGMFDREVDNYQRKIKASFYDVVLFEYMPELNNFYPFEIRDTLHEYYQQIDSFPSHRDGSGTFEVFVKKDTQ